VLVVAPNEPNPPCPKRNEVRAHPESFLEVNVDAILIAPIDQSPSRDCCAIFASQARLLAERAERALPITSGSLQRLVQIGEQLDAIREGGTDH
jgi:hypothetical protein